MTQPILPTEECDRLADILSRTHEVGGDWHLVAATVIDMIVLAEEIGFNKGVKASLGIDLE